jgi:Rrf2 family protein
VNLALSKRGDYVVRSAICLAKNYESALPKKLRQVSSEMGVPRTYVSQILGDLARAGLAVSSFGKSGGYRLSRRPEEVTLLEVVEAAEGALALDTCVLGDAPCQWESVCPLHETWGAAAVALRTVLATTTLADLVERDRAIEAGTYAVSGEGHRHHQPAFAVEDSVQVELAATTVSDRLQAGGSWLVSHLEAARAEGEAILVRIGPGGPAWLGKVVAVHLGTPRGSEEDLAIPVTWEATGPSGLFPRLEGELRVRALDPDRSELHLSGSYRPPLGRAGQALDEALLTRVAHATVRSLLRRLAHALEDEPAPRSVGHPSDDRERGTRSVEESLVGAERRQTSGAAEPPNAEQ